nr:MAG TPA: hypothetical protein [Caudoviricetes sp.]DAX73562.1 MAG TPA: hypothetical protein [Caudoviricetes sp.]
MLKLHTLTCYSYKILICLLQMYQGKSYLLIYL